MVKNLDLEDATSIEYAQLNKRIRTVPEMIESFSPFAVSFQKIYFLWKQSVDNFPFLYLLTAYIYYCQVLGNHNYEAMPC